MRLMPLLSWKEWICYRKECLKTTWTFRLASVAVIAILFLVTRSIWIPAIGSSLACEVQDGRVDAVLIENFDRNYLLFERASRLHDSGVGKRVLIPVQTSNDPVGSSVEEGIVDVMIRKSRLRDAEPIRVQEVEPIALNVARQVRDVLIREKVGSVLVVTTGFRSARTMLIYRAVLDPAGIRTLCAPVFGSRRDEWAKSWHGIQDVTLQFLKLQYYRFYVMPFLRDDEPSSLDTSTSQSTQAMIDGPSELASIAFLAEGPPDRPHR